MQAPSDERSRNSLVAHTVRDFVAIDKNKFKHNKDDIESLSSLITTQLTQSEKNPIW